MAKRLLGVSLRLLRFVNWGIALVALAAGMVGFLTPPGREEGIWAGLSATLFLGSVLLWFVRHPHDAMEYLDGLAACFREEEDDKDRPQVVPRKRRRA